MDIKKRFERPTSAWVKLSIWSLIYILFIMWVGNYWWMLLYPIVFDIFVTKFIPWGFWRKWEKTNRTLYTIFSWIDAIAFALIAVYFINLYLFQNYQIPSSSLEQTLKVGDFLAVSKCAYGPRIPNTPLSFPLVQHTFPWGSKSYIEKPQWEYRRLAGYDTIKRGDIVVFNFPAGDTLPQKISNPDYYTICFNEAIHALQYSDKLKTDSVIPYTLYRELMNTGAKLLKANKAHIGNIISRPVDRRENYVKRCVALPGETLEIRNNTLYINGTEYNDPEGVQHNYLVQTNGGTFTAESLHKIGVSVSETGTLNGNTYSGYLQYIGMTPANGGKWGPIYTMAMTKEVKEKIGKMPMVRQIEMEKLLPEQHSPIFPLAYSTKWTRDNFGPLVIPAKGMTIELTEDNIIRYERCIGAYERNTLEWRNGKAYINGKESTTYTFKMDYYWMMGDNRHNSADSRMWGFVPEDHIVGRPMFIWLSLDRDKEWFDGKIRWSRFGKDASR